MLQAGWSRHSRTWFKSVGLVVPTSAWAIVCSRRFIVLDSARGCSGRLVYRPFVFMSEVPGNEVIRQAILCMFDQCPFVGLTD